MPRGVRAHRPTPPWLRRYWPVGRRGLGRGLSALISAGDSVGGLRFDEVPVSAIRPNTHQPRRQFSETSMKELAASIREVGILQPLVIRSTEGGFELIAGERRLRAAKEAGLDRVPVLIRQAGEASLWRWHSSRTCSGKTSTPWRPRLHTRPLWTASS